MKIYSVTEIFKGSHFDPKKKIWTDITFFVNKEGRDEYYDYLLKNDSAINLIGIDKGEGKLRCPYKKGNKIKYSFR